MRVVIDTNALVAARFSTEGAASRLLDDCIEGRVEAVVSDEIERENRAILQKVKPSPAFWERLERFYSSAIRVTGGPRLDVVEDPADNKYLECALAGGADCIVSSDRHLLAHDGFEGIRICKAGQIWVG
ncbi:MAG: putative toxin-antitoxin system toxin component, PIN family [Acidobacteriota bacterium]|jgi:putative PIN family toxin of toxin-antitoxin system